MLYTSLYHTMINPSVYQDVDGRYRGLDHEIHEAEEGRTNYTIFSVWDTYRALHPLFNLICPERSRDIVASMLDHYRQSVHHILPVWSHMANENWCMIGYHASRSWATPSTRGSASTVGRLSRRWSAVPTATTTMPRASTSAWGMSPMTSNRPGRR